MHEALLVITSNPNPNPSPSPSPSPNPIPSPSQEGVLILVVVVGIARTFLMIYGFVKVKSGDKPTLSLSEP